MNGQWAKKKLEAGLKIRHTFRGDDNDSYLECEKDEFGHVKTAIVDNIGQHKGYVRDITINSGPWELYEDSGTICADEARRLRSEVKALALHTDSLKADRDEAWDRVRSEEEHFFDVRTERDEAIVQVNSIAARMAGLEKNRDEAEAYIENITKERDQAQSQLQELERAPDYQDRCREAVGVASMILEGTVFDTYDPLAAVVKLGDRVENEGARIKTLERECGKAQAEVKRLKGLVLESSDAAFISETAETMRRLIAERVEAIVKQMAAKKESRKMGSTIYQLTNWLIDDFKLGQDNKIICCADIDMVCQWLLSDEFKEELWALRRTIPLIEDELDEIVEGDFGDALRAMKDRSEEWCANNWSNKNCRMRWDKDNEEFETEDGDGDWEPTMLDTSDLRSKWSVFKKEKHDGNYKKTQED